MCFPMLAAQAAPTNASLVQGACRNIPPVHEKYEAGCNPPHMNWAQVDDTRGIPRAQMRWVVEG
jgi:hypothetical protein